VLDVGKTELFTLEWTNVNYENTFIQVYATKTKTWRKIPFTSEFGKRLKEMQIIAKTPFICEYWSPQTKIARPIERIHKSWRTALKRAGLNYHCVFYDVRHLYATTLLNRGADLISVSALLGHASAKMTADIYAHSSEHGMRRAVSLLKKETPED
jgi:integrase